MFSISPDFLTMIADDNLRNWAAELHALWKELGRKVIDWDTPSYWVEHLLSVWSTNLVSTCCPPKTKHINNQYVIRLFWPCLIWVGSNTACPRKSRPGNCRQIWCYIIKNEGTPFLGARFFWDTQYLTSLCSNHSIYTRLSQTISKGGKFMIQVANHLT